MAEDEPIFPDDTNDGFAPEDPEAPTPIIPVSQSSEIAMEDFDANYALAGGVLYAKKTDPGQDDDGKYYAATEFSDKSSNSYYPFTAKVEGKTHYFNAQGQTSQGLYTLKKTKATITGTGNKPGDTHQNSDSKYVYMPTLNFRETVAMQVLTALIGHMPDPLSYSETTMITLVKKSFSFAREFLNQALDLREPNTKDDGDDPEPIDTPDVAAMKNLQKAIETAFIDTTTGSEPVQTSKLDRLNDALYDSQTSNPFLAKLNKLDELSPIRESLIDNTTTPTTTVLTKLDEIVDAMSSGVDAQTIAAGIDQSSALQAIHGVLATDTNNIQSDVHSIATETNVIREALHNPNNANDTIFGRVQGIGNDTDVIRGEVTQINNKIQ